MRILVDTNVVLDFLLAREPFKEDAKNVFSLAAYDETYEFVSSSAMTDIFYHIYKETKNSRIAQDKIRDLMKIVTVLNVTELDIERALDLGWQDFEDAVQCCVAKANAVDVIITRNNKDFEDNAIPVVTPAEFLAGIEPSKVC